MFEKIKNIILFVCLCLSLSCGQDIGVTTQYTEETIIEGIPVVESGRVYDQAVDILFIIDESCSMNDDYVVLNQTMPDIYQILTGDEFIDLKWRVGIKSADPRAPIYDWVDYDDPDVAFKLYALSALLENHSYEKGLDSAIDAMAWDETGFFRDEADLLIIYISDEPDQSSISVSQYESLVSTFKYEPFEVTESAIVATYQYDRCDGGQLGEGYMDVAEVIIDMCDTQNWAKALDTPRYHLPTLNEVWYLNNTPLDSDLITVYYSEDGNTWGAWNDWYYDESTNAVYLTVIPDSGGFINIAYTIA